VCLVAARTVGIPDGRLGDVQVAAEKRYDPGRLGGTGQAHACLQDIGAASNLAASLSRVPFHVLTEKLLGHLPQTQRARAELRQVEEGFWHQSSLTRGAQACLSAASAQRFFCYRSRTLYYGIV
jgi:hypothetical protein